MSHDTKHRVWKYHNVLQTGKYKNINIWIVWFLWQIAMAINRKIYFNILFGSTVRWFFSLGIWYLLKKIRAPTFEIGRLRNYFSGWKRHAVRKKCCVKMETAIDAIMLSCYREISLLFLRFSTTTLLLFPITLLLKETISASLMSFTETVEN